MPDPKLLEARDRIRAVLDELDIAGHVVLHNKPGKVEVLHKLDPSYSKLLFDPPMMALRSKLDDYHGDADAQRRDLEATASLVRCFGEVLATDAMMLLEMSKIIDDKVGAEHTPLYRDDEDRPTH
jgi:hypothetical protein